MFTLQLCLPIHQHKQGVTVSPSPFAWKGHICSLLESVIGADHWYLFYRNMFHLQELPRQGDEMQPDQESDRRQRGSLWFYLHSCPGDVTQHLTGIF